MHITKIPFSLEILKRPCSVLMSALVLLKEIAKRCVNGTWSHLIHLLINVFICKWMCHCQSCTIYIQSWIGSKWQFLGFVGMLPILLWAASMIGTMLSPIQAILLNSRTDMPRLLHLLLRPLVLVPKLVRPWPRLSVLLQPQPSSMPPCLCRPCEALNV
jgi:hypothetical protein